MADRAVPRYLREVVDIARAAGWEYIGQQARGRNHPRLIPPEGTVDRTGQTVNQVVLPGSPSDRRSLLNSVSFLRRCGLEIPHRGRR